MTLPLARDLARHSIRVMTIAPNMFVSSMTDKLPQKVRRSLESDLIYPKRFGQPVEFAETVRFVLTNPYVNGETIRLSGMLLHFRSIFGILIWFLKKRCQPYASEDVNYFIC